MKPSTLCFSFIALCGSVMPQRAAEPSLEAFIESRLAEYRVPGAVVVIVEEGKPTYVKGFGVADLTGGRKVDANTRFQLASVTKTFTGALYGKAIDLKEIKAGQPVREVFPLFRLHDAYATKWATCSDLLAHRSGLPAFEGGLLEMLGFRAGEILAKVPDIAPASSFRQQAAYSNIGYFLAGEATVHAGRQPWAMLIKTRLLAPLQMNDTGLAESIMTNSANVAKPYIKLPDGSLSLTEPNYQKMLQPAGALASTGSDMAKYLAMWLNEGRAGGQTVLSKKSIEHLFMPLIAEEPGFAELPPISPQSGFDYTAGGWGTYHFGNHRVLEKGGALEGYRTVVVLVPEKKWGAAILCNLNLTVFPEAIRAELLERLLGRSGEDMQAAIRERSVMIEKMVLPPTPPENAKPPTAPLSAFCGTYVNSHYGRWEVVERDGALLFIAGPAKLKGKLTPWDANDFLVSWPLVNAGKAMAEFRLHQNRATAFTFDEKFLFRRIQR